MRDHTHARWTRNDTEGKSQRPSAKTRVVHDRLYPGRQAILQRNELHEGGQKLKVPYAGPKSQTPCIDFDMTEYVIHWIRAVTFPILLATSLVDNGSKIRETGCTPFEVKNEIFFHQPWLVITSSQIPRSTYDAVKVRSSAKVRTPLGKEIGIVIKLSTLVETFPNKVFLTPTGILVVSRGPNVNDYDKRLVIPANKFHAIQIGTNANTNPGVSYPLNEPSRKDWSDQVNLILTQLSIPNVTAQDIKTVHQYVKGFTTNYEDRLTA